GGGVNPFLSDSDEDEDEVSATDERRAGLRLVPELGSPGKRRRRPWGALGETPARLSIDAIAAQLLRDQYLLTTLELHTELLESGRELPRLRDYFPNPGNFERQSGTPPGTGAPGVPGATGLGGAGGREQSTTSCGGQLKHEVPLQERKNYKSSPEIQEPVKPLEKRALNFLISELLLKNNCKLTSITFSDENDDQDFELWDDVGLNIPKPPDSLQPYRYFGNHQVTGKILWLWPVNSLLVQRLEDKISLLNSEKWSLMEQIRRLESEMDFLKNEHFASPVVCDIVQPSLDQSPHKDSEDSGKNSVINSLDKGENKDVHLSKSDEVDSTVPKENFLYSFPRREREGIPSSSPSSKNTVHFDKPNRKLSPAFHQALLSFYSEMSIMLILGRCLPHIISNVLLAKRECPACPHPEPKEGDQLLHVLFSFIERPDDEQLQMVLTGCVAFARHVGPTRVDAELLPQCWEQSNHKYPERRLVVAESCGALILSSLVLSMLQQMLMEDKADLVREAVIKSLGIIMGYIDDPDKYQQPWVIPQKELLVSATHQVFLPAYAAWTTELGNLQSHLIPTFFHLLMFQEGEHGLDEHKLHMYLPALQSLIPSLFALVLQNAPFSSKAKLHGDVPQIEVTEFPRPVSPLQDVSTAIGSRDQLASPLQLYDYQLEHEGTTGWESLLWVVSQLLPQLIEIVGKINVTSAACVHEFSRFFWCLCWTFGQIFTNTKFDSWVRNSSSNVCALLFLQTIKSLYSRKILFEKKNLYYGVLGFTALLHLISFPRSSRSGVLTKATVPIYATEVLTCYIQVREKFFAWKILLKTISVKQIKLEIVCFMIFCLKVLDCTYVEVSLCFMIIFSLINKAHVLAEAHCKMLIFYSCYFTVKFFQIYSLFSKLSRLQQYVNHELPDVQAGFRKGRGTRDQIANIHWIIEKAREYADDTTLMAETEEELSRLSKVKEESEKNFAVTRGNSSSAQRTKFQGQGHVSPLPFVLATAFLADSSTAHVEASSRRVFGMTGCRPGLSSSVGPILLKEGPTPFGEGLWTSSFHTAKGWSKASSARCPKGAIGWIFKLLLVCSL
ncbi:hypothetical protein FD754_010096, partial [Muntiacus muntjak]